MTMNFGPFYVKYNTVFEDPDQTRTASLTFSFRGLKVKFTDVMFTPVSFRAAEPNPGLFNPVAQVKSEAAGAILATDF